jgi:hypothetical protein
MTALNLEEARREIKAIINEDDYDEFLGFQSNVDFSVLAA